MERGTPQGKHQSANLSGTQYLNVPMSPLQGSYDDGRHSPSEAKMEDAMHMVLNRRYLEHDVHAMFSALMEHARQWYEWRTETVEGSLAQSRSSKVQVSVFVDYEFSQTTDTLRLAAKERKDHRDERTPAGGRAEAGRSSAGEASRGCGYRGSDMGNVSVTDI